MDTATSVAALVVMVAIVGVFVHLIIKSSNKKSS